MESEQLNRIAIHHQIIRPGERTSRPHAESLEEEFFYVLEGEPHVWLNGYTKQLKPGFAVGFPAGTGILHTVLNNTNKAVHILTIGERTKAENKCAFSHNPEMKNDPIWWSDAPPQELGPHNGQPTVAYESPTATTALPAAITLPDAPAMPAHLSRYVIDTTELPHKAGFHYPGDDETFSEGVRLTETLGLKALGIWHELLQPGHRSSYPHSHLLEDEFVYVVSGRVKIWLNGHVREVGSGSRVLFPAGTNLAHCVINDSNAPALLVAGGDSDQLGFKEKVHYPMNPSRNAQCRYSGYYWEDRPQAKDFGSHSGRPANPPKNRLRMELVSKEQTVKEVETLLRVFEASPDYFDRVEGAPASEKFVRMCLNARPTKMIDTYLCEFFTLFLDDEPVGALDFHIHHPNHDSAYLGLLLLKEDKFGKGLGRRAYKLAEDYVKRIHKTKEIKLGISEANDVSEFWKKMGFTLNGRTYTWKGEAKDTLITEYEKTLS